MTRTIPPLSNRGYLFSIVMVSKGMESDMGRRCDRLSMIGWWLEGWLWLCPGIGIMAMGEGRSLREERSLGARIDDDHPRAARSPR
jgi:hypothetical protein